MMQKLLNLFFVFMMFFFGNCFFLSGEIIETNEIKTMISFVNQNSFVFFNVDCALYAPYNQLTDSRWKDYFINRVETIISDYEIREQLIDAVNNQINCQIPKKNCEEIAPRLIDFLQHKNIVVLGITQNQVFNSQIANLDEVINNHLISMNIDFGKTLGYFSLSRELDDKNGHFSFEKGVLFTNKQSIGAPIILFLKKSNKQPTNVIVVDESYEALEDAEESLALARIPFTGIHFDKMNDSEEFDPTLGTIEFFALINDGKIVSDEEAVNMMPTDRSIDYEALLDKYIEDSAAN